MDIAHLADRSRRDGIDALSIPLADGNHWGLALPSTRLRPETIEGFDGLGRPSKTVRLSLGFGYPPEIRKLIQDLRSACEQAEPVRRYDALIRLAAALVRRAHEIDQESAMSLLEMGVDELPGLVEAVLSVVSGRRPLDSGPMRKVDHDG